MKNRNFKLKMLPNAKTRVIPAKILLCFICLTIMFNGNVIGQANLNNISIGSKLFMRQQDGKFTLDETDDFKKMEDKFTFGNLRIYMLQANNVYLNNNRSLGNYTSLKEALASNKILVTEMGGGNVNNLEIENVSNDTIMILAGEVVAGGKQDRVMGQDVLLKPHSGKVQVSVFCVEHGRWTPNGTGYQFTGYSGVTTGSVRKQAVVGKDQHAVWDKVADVTQKSKSETSTGTYSAIQNSDQLKIELPKYIQYLEPLMLSDSSYIGFVAVTGDTIISCDLFATNNLFRKQATQLLKSSAIEAITSGAAVSIAASKVMAFISEFLSNESEQETKVNENGTLLNNGGKKVHMNYYKK